MPHDDAERLRDMLLAARKIRERLRGVSRDDFEQDEFLVSGVLYFLLVIGEAASKVTAEYRLVQPGIPWKLIVGLRHRLVHDYARIDREIIWLTATTHLDSLIGLLESLVSDA